MSDKAKLAARIAHFRALSGQEQQDLATTMGVSVQAVRGWEQGSRSPSVLVLRRLALALGVTPDVLLDLDADELPKRGRGRPRKKEPTG